MRVHKAEFLASAGKPSEFPPGRLPEVAFCGRSNVGKSSLINSLLGRKNLVRTSKTPGRTRRINFFEADERLRFVDLPGYGYAKVSLDERDSWKPMVESYLTDRPALKLCVLLVDMRRQAMDADLEMHAYLQATGQPFVVVATKADKLNRSEFERIHASLTGVYGSSLLAYSSQTGLGRTELWRRISVACLESRTP